MTEPSPCPCKSGMEYASCCKRFHKGAFPENALLLMRARYSAYVLNFTDYLMVTTHPANPQHNMTKTAWKQQLLLFSKATTFHNLEILDFKENQNIATVTFTAYLSQKGDDATFTERSYFEKIGKRWFYQGGQTNKGRIPELVITEPLQVLPLAYYGEEGLRKKAEPVAEITKDIRKLVQDMIETLKAYDGFGISAPQVNKSLQIFVIHQLIPIEQRLERGDPKVFINPKIVSHEENFWHAPETSLSLPGINSIIDRPEILTVEYTTLDGSTVRQQHSFWEARLIMHHCDHLAGTLMVDKLSEKERAALAPFLQQLQQRIYHARAF